MKATDTYRELRESVGQEAGALEQLHCVHLACKPGCHDCCTNLSVFPVEFHAILEDLQASGVKGLSFDPSAKCGFLDGEGLCKIYRFRPMICRTHGLPIAFLNSDADEPEMSVSFCPLNFLDADEISFGPDSTINIDDLNYRLYEANVQFIEENPQLGYELDGRVALVELVKRLE